MKRTKLVNIYPSMPIVGVNPPIRSSVRRVNKSIEDIRTCLMARAIIEEILDNGDVIRLNIANYDRDNNIYKNTNTVQEDVAKESEETVTKEDTVDPEKSIWQKAYDKALEGVDLASMSRKQRRSAEASARSAANKAVEDANKLKEEIESKNEQTEDAEEISIEQVVEETIDTTINAEETETIDIESDEFASIE